MKCEKMSFEECELAILRQAVDKAENREGRKKINNPEIALIIEIVENFLKQKRRICYGGTAINNILPEQDQFYDKETELPDYDFFSPDPMKDAKTLADIYYKKGFTEVEAKSGAHAGTFKVFVNFIPVADITFLIPELYNSIMKKAISVGGIYYSPPNYLRMLMYLELSRPSGDISRWEKVLKRIILLNKNFPLKGKDCDFIEIQRIIDPKSKLTKTEQNKIFDITRDSFVSQGLIFFGAMANEMYLKYLKSFKHKLLPKIPDFDVLSTDPFQSATILKERLKAEGIKKITIKKHKGVGEIIAPHYEIKIRGETIAFIYEPLACHSYNIIHIKGKKIKVATIDTMLSFYLAFLYVNRPYYDPNRIICMSEFLFKVQQKNRLQQKGLLKRFSVNCYGTQLTMEKMREEKANKYKELKNKRGSKEWEWFFLKYSPADNELKKLEENTKNTKNTKITKNTKNTKNAKKYKPYTKKKTRKKKNKTRKIKSRVMKFLGL
jgi:hypothetical protein